MLLVYFACTELYKMMRRKFTASAYLGGPKSTEKDLPRFETKAVTYL
jgi:hypothetical protein